MELKQRKLFNSNKFLIRDSGVEWSLREKFNSQNTFFEFEELNFKKATKYKKYNLAFIILSILSIIALFLSLIPSDNKAFDSTTIVVFSVLSLVFVGLTFILRTDNIYIPTDRGVHIVMYNGLPTKKKFSAFLKNLKSEAKQSIMDKYFGDENTDQRKLYLFLNERGLLEEKEKRTFEENLKTNHRTEIKGFGKN
ncbi:hypothetical protein [Hwangdonia lutea]|uniref:Uncharacterized protein n=1 Tax=Hwangdonia lutea TaxID=3075823 RepID=A0AA97EPC8_9FLAO|nr:hypothetical protein [Hwangdonia sp. SCSIO 19198]WOD43780.1 hypothetical protein RNZ46_00600 [Hwangdonia sp. SCSIO 19198]